MILTYKLKHNRDFSDELVKAKHIAQVALESPNWLSSKAVKYIGLKSAISCQILTKYHKRNRNVKRIRSVKLTLPSKSCKRLENEIYVPCLKLRIEFSKDIEKINQIELDNKYAYVSCTVKEDPKFEINTHIGIDCNTVGNLCTVCG